MNNRTKLLTVLQNQGASDTTAPTVTGFTAPALSGPLAIPIDTFTASEGGGSYLITLTADAPLPDAVGWSASVPTTHTVTEGSHTLYPWVKDSAGNVSSVYGSPVSVMAGYGYILDNQFGASEVWDLVNIASGTAITARNDAARNGALVGWDLQNAAGPVAGTLAPLSSGNNDYGHIYTTSGAVGLKEIFNPGVGWMSVCAKVLDGTVWPEAATRYLMVLYASGSNFINVYKDGTNLVFRYDAGGTLEEHSKASMTETGWMQVVVTWDNTAGADGEVKFYYNGTQQGITKTALGTWVGDLSASLRNNIGANTNAAGGWNGWLAYAAVGFGATLTPTQVLDMYNAINP
jgi:hypothetical protein